MRTNKFRAWIDTKNIRLDGDKAFMVNKIDSIDFKDKKIYWDGSFCCNFNECILMQFIGLFDNNGKEIYEGNIVKGVSGHIGRSEVFVDGLTTQPFHYLNDPYGDNFEVVGNVYENIKLLNN